MIPLSENYIKKAYKNHFLIHKHNAKRVGLHYDLRIEHKGVLESWAGRYIPELIEGKKKKILVIRQPEHPLEWFDFEGNIDDGYGAGKVEIWDKGVVEKIKWNERTGSATVRFSGTKLKGVYHLINYQQGKPAEFFMFKAKEQ